MTAIPATQKEFEALHRSCFGCGCAIDRAADRYQLNELARLGIEHLLCGACAAVVPCAVCGERRISQRAIANLVERAVVLALTERHGFATRPP